MLDAHNVVRARVGVPPLTWSDRLAAIARDWAASLIAKHRFGHNPKTPHGENLFEIEGGTATPTEVIGDWASESANFDPRSGRCRGTCGHYTQIVWRNTTEVGCAVVRSGRREVWV